MRPATPPMPISYSIDTVRRMIVSRWSGVVTTDDLTIHWRKLFTDDEALAVRRALSDLRGAELQFSGDDVQRLTTGLVLPVLEKGPWKTAMLVDQPANFGVGRQFQNYAQMFHNSSIFTEESAALEWLLAD